MDCGQKNLGTCGEWGGGEVGNDRGEWGGGEVGNDRGEWGRGEERWVMTVGMVALCRYCQLEVGSTLRDNLRHKKVVEFPILHVVMRGESNIYTHKGKVDATWKGTPLQTVPAICLVLQWLSVEIKSTLVHSPQSVVRRKGGGSKKQLRIESKGNLGGEEGKSCPRGS